MKAELTQHINNGVVLGLIIEPDSSRDERYEISLQLADTNKNSTGLPGSPWTRSKESKSWVLETDQTLGRKT